MNAKLNPENFYPQWVESGIEEMTVAAVRYAFGCTASAASKLLESLVKDGKATKSRIRPGRNVYRVVVEKALICKCCGEPIPDSQQDVPVLNRHGRRIYGLVQCGHCGAIQGSCYLGDFSGLVVMEWDTDQEPETRYFDIETVGSAGVERHHGWQNVKTGRITQIG